MDLHTALQMLGLFFLSLAAGWVVLIHTVLKP